MIVGETQASLDLGALKRVADLLIVSRHSFGGYRIILAQQTFIGLLI